MPFYTFDPLSDTRWEALLATHPRASAFHRVGWLRALADTYGYRPFVLTSTPPDQPLRDGIAFCEVNSWITGSRLISLPFADHADPLVNDASSLEFTEWLLSRNKRPSWKYIELRPFNWDSGPDSLLSTSQSFWLHTLDLTQPTESLFRKMHKDCIQRKVRRADREHLTYERGRSEALLHDFYRLLTITRKRHRLLPQPISWFRNLINHMGPNIDIRVAKKDDTALAAIVTLLHREAVIYKYGCSDDAYHQLGGMPFLFWKLIEESKAEGATLLDFGRTDMDNPGLIRFKDQFGTICNRLTYFRYPKEAAKKSAVAFYLPFTGPIFSVLPDMLSHRLGRIVYRHIA